jgi:hypothetical protein
VTRRALLIGLGLVAALAAVAVAAVIASRGGGSRDEVLPGEQPIAVRSWVEPESQLFGDPALATIDVVVDSGRVDVDSVAVDASFAPYDVVGEPVRTRTVDGPLVRLRTQYRLQCLAQVCVPEHAQKPLTLPPARVAYVRANGTPGQPRAVQWPRLTITSQFEGGTPRQNGLGETFTSPIGLRARVQPPGDPSWRASPLLVQILLIGGAVVLVGIAALLLLPFMRRKPEAEPAPAPVIELTPLERALVGLDWARAEGGSKEQRKALELLAEELEADTEDDLTSLADDARVLAWSARPPGDESTEVLAQRVREIVEARAAARAEAAMEAEPALAGASTGNGRHA